MAQLPIVYFHHPRCIPRPTYSHRRPNDWHQTPPRRPDLYRCLHRLHYELGPGFWHSIYRKAAQVELKEQGITCCYVHEIPVYYEDQYISTRQCRLIFIDSKILLAAFAVRQMTDAFETRMRQYLNYFDKESGLLANFHGERLDIRPVRVGEVPTACRNARWS